MMTKPSTARIATLIGITAAFVCWISFVVNQHSPTLILAVVFGSLGVTFAAMWRFLTPTASRWKRRAIWALAGAAAGYAGSVLAALVTECALRGAVCLERDVTSNLYFFPLVTFGWAYGALVPLIWSSFTEQERTEKA